MTWFMDTVEYPGKMGRVPGLPDIPPIGLNSHIYIGNEAKYAGFAVNRPNATMPDTQGNPVTYEQHGKKTSVKLLEIATQTGIKCTQNIMLFLRLI